jgi:CheY-like chemotaxis protein
LFWQGYCFTIGLTTGTPEFARPWIHQQDRKSRANGKNSIILSFQRSGEPDPPVHKKYSHAQELPHRGLTAKSRISMHRPINILVVEDDPNVSTVLTARLESLGYQICGTAETGLEAISGVYRHHPDLVTMDILLKGEMNGVEAATKIAEGSDVPIIYMTCLSDQTVFEGAIRTNPYGYIIKPYDINELRSAIEIAMLKHAHAKERESLIAKLKKALEEVKTLSGLLPICASCKKIRNDDENSWQQIEDYIASHSDAGFTHGICPDCARRLYPELYKNKG